MAWVGGVRNDPGKTVDVTGSYGDSRGYLNTLNLTWEENSPLGQGPGGAAIRSGRTQVMQDFMADSRMRPWRTSAIELGVQSSVSIPLKDGEHVYGLLAAYARDPDAFDNDEVKLLEEIANDLSRCTMSFRKGTKT